jgi:hypothetical protein
MLNPKVQKMLPIWEQRLKNFLYGNISIHFIQLPDISMALYFFFSYKKYIPNNIAQNYFWQAGCMDN